MFLDMLELSFRLQTSFIGVKDLKLTLTSPLAFGSYAKEYKILNKVLPAKENKSLGGVNSLITINLH